MLHFPHICPRKKNKANTAAFTMVELLISVGIFSVISIAVFSTFSSGLKVLRKAKMVDLTRQKILLKEERFSRELRESLACRKKLFSGKTAKLSFSGSDNHYPSRITYYFDEATQSILREVDRLSDIIAAESEGSEELKPQRSVFMAKVESAQFSYLFLDLKKNDYIWKDEWKEDYLPIAVKLVIVSQGNNYATTVFLPTA
ncbi:MAG: type II secretion system protein [Candidatus Omnitrophota bacterium]